MKKLHRILVGGLFLVLIPTVLALFGTLVSADPPKTSTTVPEPVGTPPQGGHPLEYNGNPPPTPVGPSQTWVGPDGKLQAIPQTVPGQGGVWTLAWTALYATAWVAATRRKRVETPIYQNQVVTQKVPVTKMVPRQVVVGHRQVPKQVQVGSYTTYERQQTGTRTVAERVVVGYHTWSEKIQTGVRRWTEYVQQGWKAITKRVQVGWKTTWQTVLAGYRWASRQVLTGYHAVTRWVQSWRPVTRQVVSGYHWRFSWWRGWYSEPEYRTETTWESTTVPQTTYEPTYRTEYYQEPVYKQVPVSEPVYETITQYEPNMVPVERVEPVYQTIELKEPIWGTRYHEEPVYNTVPVQHPIYGTQMVSEDIVETRLQPETVMEDRTTVQQVQVGTHVEFQNVTEMEEQSVFQGWQGTWSFTPTSTPSTPPAPSNGSSRQALNDQLFAQQQRWWRGNINKNQAEMDAAAAEGRRLRALGATVPEAQTAQMKDALLHDALLADKRAWWEACLVNDQSGMARATAHADYLRSLGAVVSEAETQAMNKEYEAQITTTRNQGKEQTTTTNATDSPSGNTPPANPSSPPTGGDTDSMSSPTTPPATTGNGIQTGVVHQDPKPLTDISRLKSEILEAKRTWWAEWVASDGRTDTPDQVQAGRDVKNAIDEAAQKGIPLDQINITEEQNWELHADALYRIKQKWWVARLAGNTTEQAQLVELANYLRTQRLELKEQSATYARLAAEEGMLPNGDFSSAQNDAINLQYESSIKAARQARLEQLSNAATRSWLSAMPTNNEAVSQLVKVAGEPGEEAVAEVTADFAAFQTALTKWWEYVDDPAGVDVKRASDAEATMNRISKKYRDLGLKFPGMEEWKQHKDELQALDAGFRAMVADYWMKRAEHDDAADDIRQMSIPVWLRYVSPTSKAWFDSTNQQNETELAIEEQRWQLLSSVNERTSIEDLHKYQDKLRELAVRQDQARRDGSTLRMGEHEWESKQSQRLGERYQSYFRQLLRLRVQANFEAADGDGAPSTETQQQIVQLEALVALLRPFLTDSEQHEKLAEADQKNGVGRAPTAEEIQWIQALYGIGGEDGRYGPRTRDAVKGLQEQHGITVDDYVSVGPQTITALQNEYLGLVHSKWEAIARGQANSETEAKLLRLRQDSRANPEWVMALTNLDANYEKYRNAQENWYKALLQRDIVAAAQFKKEIEGLSRSGVQVKEFAGLKAYPSAINGLYGLAKRVLEGRHVADQAKLLAVVRAANQGSTMSMSAVPTALDYAIAGHNNVFGDAGRGTASGIVEFLERNYPDLTRQDVDEAPIVTGRYPLTAEEAMAFDVSQPSGLSGVQLDQLLVGTDMSGMGQFYADAEEKYGINALFMIAKDEHESDCGRSSGAKQHHNLGGWLEYNPSTKKTDKFIDFKTYQDCIMDGARRLKEYYVNTSDDLKTIPEIGAKYCPVGADNDPTGLNQHWVSGVAQFFSDLGREASQLGSPIGYRVPLLKQAGQPWSDLTLCDGTWADYGCTLTSLAMLIQFNKPDVTVDRSFMQALRDSVTEDRCGVVWDRAEKYLNSIGLTGPGAENGAIVWPTSQQDLMKKALDALCGGHPVMFGTYDPHWVVVKGYVGNGQEPLDPSDFTISDPGKERLTLRDFFRSYSGTIDKMVIVKPK